MSRAVEIVEDVARIVGVLPRLSYKWCHVYVYVLSSASDKLMSAFRPAVMVRYLGCSRAFWIFEVHNYDKWDRIDERDLMEMLGELRWLLRGLEEMDRVNSYVVALRIVLELPEESSVRALMERGMVLVWRGGYSSELARIYIVGDRSPEGHVRSLKMCIDEALTDFVALLPPEPRIRDIDENNPWGE